MCKETKGGVVSATSGMRVKSNVKAGAACGWGLNHSQTVKGLRVSSGVSVGGYSMVNHSQAVKGVRIKSNVKAGIRQVNHNQTVRGLRLKSSVRAGFRQGNRNQTITR